MEQHIHLLHRRGTLLKNKVIDIYNEHVSKLESDLEEVTTAMTCIVSLKEFHEKLIAQAQCRDVGRGVADLDDVFENVSRKISPSENHIVFEEKHGLDRFRIAAKDLGRVRNSRPTAPRAEPDGGRDPPTRTNSTTTPSTPQASDSDASPATTSDRTALPGGDRSGSATPTPTPTQPTLDINKNNSSSAPDKPHQCPRDASQVLRRDAPQDEAAALRHRERCTRQAAARAYSHYHPLQPDRSGHVRQTTPRQQDVPPPGVYELRRGGAAA